MPTPAAGTEVSRPKSGLGAIGLSLCALLAGTAAFALTLELSRRPDIAAGLALNHRALAAIACAGLILGFVGILMYGRNRRAAAPASPASPAAAASPATDVQRAATPAAPVTTAAAPSSAAPAIAALSESLLSVVGSRTGFRALVAADAAMADCNRDAIDLAVALGRAGKQVMIVDWRTDAASVSAELGLSANAGLTELLRGEAAFVDVVRRAPGSTAHIIPPGSPAGLDMERLDAERVNLVLDALDQAYDCILVVAAHADARELFEGTQGRFDAGILIADAAGAAKSAPPKAGRFLGFEVSGIAILHHLRTR